MSLRTREDKKTRKEIRKFFQSESGQIARKQARQNGIMKIALTVAVVIIIIEAAIIWAIA